MNLYYIIALICAFILTVTAVARLNDMGRSNSDWHWWVRRLGMLAVVTSCAFFALSPWYEHEVDGVEVLLMLGVTLSWITTPSQPPWWNYIVKGEQPGSGRRATDKVPPPTQEPRDVEAR